MKLTIEDKAVAELIGAVILLAMAVSVFSVIYMNVLSDDGPDPNVFLRVIGKIDNNFDVIFDHTLGEELSIDSPINITYGGRHPIEDIIGKPCDKIGDLLSEIFKKDGKWNIGEQLVYPLNSKFKDYEIKAYICDKESNSMVFWGTLQEGKTFESFGGIWHFNESYWNGKTGEVKDSSGNGNHGTSHNGANTTDDVVSPSANRSGIFNVIDYDDYVVVPDDLSLNLKNQITMEAWVKPFLDSYENMGLMDHFGYTPYITNISGSKTLFAAVSEDTGHEANLQTINITPHKQLSENSLVDIEYDFGEGEKETNLQKIRPIITHVSDNVYIVAYNSKNANGVLNVNLKTFIIDSDGYIEYTGNNIFDDNNSDIGEPNRPSIVKISDFASYSIFAIAYGINVDGHPSVGIIKTINISYDGKIKYTGERANFDDVEGYGPNIIHIAGDVFAIAYRNTSNLGVIKTFNISSDGSIIYTGKEFVFDDKTNDGTLNPPSIVKVSNSGSYSIFVIAYGAYIDNHHPGVGIVKTIKIYYSNGTIIGTGSNKIFESSSCFNPCIIHHSENYYIIVYSVGNPPHGNYSTIEIADNGSIILKSNNILVLTFQNNQRCEVPMAIKISERYFGIIFQGQAGGNGHPGYLMPIQIEYQSDLYSKGIHKTGSYGIYANPSEVYVNINKKTISGSIVANSWNYVVLTYDRHYIRLYVNGILKSSAPLIEEINSTDSDLIFGDLFYGLIDEVAIYDKVLSDQEVYNHFKQFAPIIISNVNSSDITYNSAYIIWDTNKLSNSIVRYGITTPPTITKSDGSLVTSHGLSLQNLVSKTTYFYEVESTGDGYTIIDNNGGRYYMFITENRAPNVPRLPNPSDGKKVGTDVILSWVGGDEDNDDVTYDVYLYIKNSPAIKVSANQSAELYNPDPDLIPGKTYNWQIIAWDNYGASTAGPIWYFITKNN